MSIMECFEVPVMPDTQPIVLEPVFKVDPAQTLV